MVAQTTGVRPMSRGKGGRHNSEITWKAKVGEDPRGNDLGKRGSVDLVNLVYESLLSILESFDVGKPLSLVTLSVTLSFGGFLFVSPGMRGVGSTEWGGLRV